MTGRPTASQIDRRIDTDVLVVGGGGGGMRAAVAAHEAGAEVLVLCKGIVGKSGLTQTAVTGFQVALGHADPRDNPGVHFDDSIRGSYGLADPRLVDIFTRGAAQAVHDIEAFGGRFDREPDGRFMQRSLDSSQTYPRSIRKGDSLGTPIMQALRREAARRSIPQLHEHFVLRLLKDGDRVAGVVALDFRTGEIVAIRAGAVVMATGGAGELFPVNSNTPDATGEGYMLALDAGAELVDMEFFLMLGHAVLHPEAVRGVLYTFQYLLAKGARPLLNGQGETFVHRYDPEGADNPARHIYARAIFGEVREGRGSPHGGAWFDLSSVPQSLLDEVLPSQTRFLRTLGVDTTQPIEVGSAAHYVCGGIRIGTDGEASLPGLYAVGECAGGPHGAARVGGNSLTELLVFGRRCGLSAARFAGARGRAAFDADGAEAAAAAALALVEGPARDGPRPTVVKRALQDVMNRYVGVVRNDAGLALALDRIAAQRERDLPRLVLGSSDRVCNYDWIEALEVGAMVRLGAVMAEAARLRTESRGAHFREDFPETDTAGWTRNIVVRPDGGSFRLECRDVPTFERTVEAVA